MRKILILSFVSVLFISWALASSGTVQKPTLITKPDPIIKDITKNPTKGLIILGDNYAVDADFVYVVNSTRSNWVKMPNADRVTFKVLGGQFARDVDQIFQMGKKIEGAHIGTFNIISGQYGYAEDGKRVYGPNGVIADADTETFKMLTKNYSFDAGHVFFDGKNIPEANSGSFEVIENGLYAVDDKSVFYAGKILKNTSPEGFVVKWPRAFTADGRTFFEGQVEKWEKPVDEENNEEKPENPDTEVQTPSANIFAPYVKYFTGENLPFWSLVVLAYIAVFSFLFVFFADRNDESVSFWNTILKLIVSGVLGVIIFWIFSLFASTNVALVLSIIAAAIIFIALSRVFGWIKSLLVTLLSLIGFVFLAALIVLIIRAIFGDMQSFFAYAMKPEIRMISIMKLTGIFAGTYLITSQLRSSLFSSLGQAMIATLVSIGLLAFLIWMGPLSTLTSVILFSGIYAVILWIMRFRMVSNLFAETVRIVRIAIIIALIASMLIWIIL